MLDAIFLPAELIYLVPFLLPFMFPILVSVCIILND
nr:MAG TPA: S Phosphatidylinositol-glycan biosynthesis class S protein [Caudoviricetes sp.]